MRVTFSTGVNAGHEAAPLIVNNAMYIVTPWPNVLYALDLTKPGIRTANARVGPPLTLVARRMYLAGHIENTPVNMMRWIERPHA